MRLGDRVKVHVGDRQLGLPGAVGAGWGRAGVVAPETLARLTDSPEPHAIWIRAPSGADPIQRVGDLDELADSVGAKVGNGLQARASASSVDQQPRILTWSARSLA